MQSRYHILLSGGISLALLIMVKDPFAATTCFLMGVFMDMDHLVDYWMETGKLTWKINELLDAIWKSELVFIPLHSWELLLVMMILTPTYPFLLGATMGFLFHMIADLATNHAKFEGFLIMYRVNVGWRKENVFENYYPYQEQ